MATRAVIRIRIRMRMRCGTRRGERVAGARALGAGLVRASTSMSRARGERKATSGLRGVTVPPGSMRAAVGTSETAVIAEVAEEPRETARPVESLDAIVPHAGGTGSAEDGRGRASERAEEKLPYLAVGAAPAYLAPSP
eukprot:4927021-Prymnesium_polylepis.1